MLLFDPALTAQAVLLALVLDWLAGDPDWLYRRLPHPVVLIGRATSALERRWLREGDPPRVQQVRGACAALVIIGASAAVGVFAQALCLLAGPGWVILTLLMSSLIAYRGLERHVRAVAEALERGLEPGRLAVSQIVGRDPQSLDEAAVARAAIESTAENFSDGVIAPLFWGVLFGLPGMLAYKAVNTLDSMIGHRSPRYLHFGWFAARTDDGANWVPARLAAGLIILAAACLPGATPGAAVRSVVRDAGRHRSPNAGFPEAAMAGALGLRLAGPRRYGGVTVEDAWMGEGRAEAAPCDIRRALRIVSLAFLCTVAGTAAITVLAL